MTAFDCLCACAGAAWFNPGQSSATDCRNSSSAVDIAQYPTSDLALGVGEDQDNPSPKLADLLPTRRGIRTARFDHGMV